MGIEVEISHAHRDLGIMFTAGKGRNHTMKKDRMRKSKIRNHRVIRVTKFTRAARKLFSAATFPQATWGHQCFGLAPKHFLQLRRMAANTTGITQSQRCLNSVMMFCFGRRADPMLKCIKEIVTLWFDLADDMIRDGYDAELRAAWSATMDKVRVGPKIMWNRVSGLMSNVIALLYHIGWSPNHYHRWRQGWQ